MRIASVAEVKEKLNGFLQKGDEGPVVVTENGKPVAVLLTIENEEELERLILAYSPELKKILETAEQEFRDGKEISHEEFWAEVESENRS